MVLPSMPPLLDSFMAAASEDALEVQQQHTTAEYFVIPVGGEAQRWL